MPPSIFDLFDSLESVFPATWNAIFAIGLFALFGAFLTTWGLCLAFVGDKPWRIVCRGFVLIFAGFTVIYRQDMQTGFSTMAIISICVGICYGLIVVFWLRAHNQAPRVYNLAKNDCRTSLLPAYVGTIVIVIGLLLWMMFGTMSASTLIPTLLVYSVINSAIILPHVVMLLRRTWRSSFDGPFYSPLHMFKKTPPT